MKEVADDINEARRGAESLSRLYDLTTKIDDLDDLVASLSLFLSLLPLYLPFPPRFLSYTSPPSSLRSHANPLFSGIVDFTNTPP